MARSKQESNEAPAPTTVTYIGDADVKILDGHTWDASNQFSVPVEDLSKRTLEHIQSMPEFRVD